MYCLNAPPQSNFWANLEPKLIIYQIKRDFEMYKSLVYYVDYEFSVYFVKFSSFFLSAKFGSIMSNSPNRL